MTISELIRELQRVKKEHGDLPVLCWHDDEPVEEVDCFDEHGNYDSARTHVVLY